MPSMTAACKRAQGKCGAGGLSDGLKQAVSQSLLNQNTSLGNLWLVTLSQPNLPYRLVVRGKRIKSATYASLNSSEERWVLNGRSDFSGWCLHLCHSCYDLVNTACYLMWLAIITLSWGLTGDYVLLWTSLFFFYFSLASIKFYIPHTSSGRGNALISSMKFLFD